MYITNRRFYNIFLFPLILAQVSSMFKESGFLFEKLVGNGPDIDKSQFLSGHNGRCPRIFLHKIIAGESIIIFNK